MTDELERRVSDALLASDGDPSSAPVRALAAESADGATTVEVFARLDRAMRRWPVAARSGDAWEAVATRIEQRLDEALSPMADPLRPPVFDDPDARRDVEPRARTHASTPSPSAPSVRPTPSTPPPASVRPALAARREPFSLENLAALDVKGRPPARRDESIPEFALDTMLAAPPPPVPRESERVEIPDVMPVYPPTSVAPPNLSAPPLAPAPRESSGMGLFVVLAVVTLLAAFGGTVVWMQQRSAPPRAAFPEASAATAGAQPAEPHVEQPESVAAEVRRAEAPSALPMPEVPPAPARALEPSTRAEAGSAATTASAAPREPRLARPAPSAGTAADAVSTAPSTENPGAAPMPERVAVPRSAPPAPPAPEELPESPSREDVIEAFNAVRSAVQSCAGARRGVASVDVTVSGTTGRVTNAVIGGNFVGTPEGSCIARTVRTARFPRFSQPTFRVTYPFQL